VTESFDAEQQRRQAWEQRRQRLRLLQNVGLAALALGVLVLCYVALLASGK